MDPSITFEATRDGGIFRFGEGYSEIVAELDETLDQRNGGFLTLPKHVAAMKATLERHPHFIDGHAHLGFALIDQGKPKLALRACLHGLEIGQKAIPVDFTGVIDWGYLENRPFLRAAHGVALCHLRLGQRNEAIDIMEKMLSWNPNDNQGIRFLIGSEYLRAGMTRKASHIMKKEADHYPPYHYELALLELREGRTVAAATSLRRGFTANGYIAEVLSGNPQPMPLAIWHGSSDATPEAAQAYVEHYGDLWQKTPGVVPFVRWLHTHSKVLEERAAISGCREALLWERDFDRRRRLLEREEALRAQVDDGLSKEIVVERSDRHGRSVLPWLYPKVRPQFDP